MFTRRAIGAWCFNDTSISLEHSPRPQRRHLPATLCRITTSSNSVSTCKNTLLLNFITGKRQPSHCTANRLGFFTHSGVSVGQASSKVCTAQVALVLIASSQLNPPQGMQVQDAPDTYRLRFFPPALAAVMIPSRLDFLVKSTPLCAVEPVPYPSPMLPPRICFSVLTSRSFSLAVSMRLRRDLRELYMGRPGSPDTFLSNLPRDAVEVCTLAKRAFLEAILSPFGLARACLPCPVSPFTVPSPMSSCRGMPAGIEGLFLPRVLLARSCNGGVACIHVPLCGSAGGWLHLRCFAFGSFCCSALVASSPGRPSPRDPHRGCRSFSQAPSSPSCHPPLAAHKTLR